MSLSSQKPKYLLSWPSWVELQGVSVQKDKFKIMITVGLSYIRKHSWWLACSPIFSIWVSSKKSQKSYIGWPQQPLTEKVPNISKKLDFWWSIPQKGTSIGHFGAWDDQTIRIRKFSEEIGLLRLLRPVRLQRPLRSIRLERFLRPGKSLLRTSELSRILNSKIVVLISLYLDVLKKKWFDIFIKCHDES